MDKMFIANRITELRLKKNVSEYQMSLDLGRNKSYIQSLSSGRNNPTMENFLEICEYFEITPAQFFDPDITNPPLHTKVRHPQVLILQSDFLFRRDTLNLS